MPGTLIVIPCFQERERLPKFLPALCRELAPLHGVRLRVVDDGSGPGQQEWLVSYVDLLRQEYPFLDPARLNEENHGKGGAVYSGWDLPGDAERLGFVDADGAVPASEVARVLKLAEDAPGKAVFAVRTGQDGTRVTRALHRRVAGGVFRWLVRRFFRFPLPDTQCGFKLVPAAPFAAIRSDLRENHFTFDVELTWHLLHRGVSILPVPIHWTESPGSRLRPGSAWQMYRSIKALRRRLGDWRQARATPPGRVP
jgi:glycosyltransferase involved in cell wall biosynthesis